MVLLNDFPKTACMDWTIYCEILFHIMQNAIKFSRRESFIRLTISYHPIELVTKTTPIWDPFRRRSGNLNSAREQSQESQELGFLVTEV